MNIGGVRANREEAFCRHFHIRDPDSKYINLKQKCLVGAQISLLTCAWNDVPITGASLSLSIAGTSITMGTGASEKGPVWTGGWPQASQNTKYQE